MSSGIIGAGSPPAAEDQPREYRPMPLWISIPLILICLSGGVWLVRWYSGMTVPDRQTILLPDSTGRPRNQWGGPPRPREPVRQIDAARGSWMISSDQANMQIDAPGGKDPVIRVLAYSRAGLGEDLRPFVMARRIARDNATAAFLSVTPQQVDQLRPLAGVMAMGGAVMLVSDADRAKLLTLWQQFESATDKAGAQQALLAGLNEVAGSSLPATRAKLSATGDKIKSILTPEQISKFDQMGR